MEISVGLGKITTTERPREGSRRKKVKIFGNNNEARVDLLGLKREVEFQLTNRRT